MAAQLTSINPEVLSWARKRSGLSVEDVAIALNKDTQLITDWETGAAHPTYAQLEKLAYSHYKRPIALFFFPEPPNEPDPVNDFRTLSDTDKENLSTDTRFALRQAEATQLSLIEMSDGRNLSEKRIFKDIQITGRTTATQLAKKVRKYLSIEISEQKAWKNSDIALKNWREAVENHGVYVFKRSFKQKDIFGFCLDDTEFPVIYINNSVSFNRQIFTLFHELGHILVNTGGIAKADDSFLQNLPINNRKIEVFVNEFAAEFLVPSTDLVDNLPADFKEGYSISYLASEYNVSREVIARKLLELKFINQDEYQEKIKGWADAAENSRGGKKSGGNYYSTQVTYLGNAFLDLAFSKYYRGQFGIEKLADYLNVKVKSVQGIETAYLKKAAG